MVSDATTDKIMSILAILICIKFFATIIKSGVKQKRPPEDKSRKIGTDENELLMGSASDVDVTFSNRERWSRIVQNEIENVPVTLALLIYSIITPNTINELNIAMALLFLIARILHTICYVYALQPWRSLSWLGGLIGTFGFMVNIIYGTFKE